MYYRLPSIAIFCAIINVAKGFSVQSKVVQAATTTPTTTPTTPTQQQQLSDDDDDGNGNGNRRSFLSKMLLVGGGLTMGNGIVPTLAAHAEELQQGSGGADSKFSVFTDSDIGFSFNVPKNWNQSEQKLPDRRRLVLFVDDKDGASGGGQGLDDLVFIAYTPVRADFTSLASFGSVDMVAQATILPKGELAGLDSDNQMLSAESKKNAYYFDYTTKTPDQPKRHFRTIFTMVPGGTGGAGSVLVAITAQTLESRYDEAMKSTFDQIIDSYKKM